MLIHSKVLLASPWLLLAVKVAALPAHYIDPRAGGLEYRAPANENPYGPRPGHGVQCEHEPCPTPTCNNPPCNRAAVEFEFKPQARDGPGRLGSRAQVATATAFVEATARGQGQGKGRLEARIEDGATTPTLDPLERGDSVHHSNNGPPGPNGPSCEHPPCPGLIRDLNGHDAPDRREMAPGPLKRESYPSIGPLERGDAGPHFGPGPVQPTWPTCLHPPCPGHARDLTIDESPGARDLVARMGNDDDGRTTGPIDPVGPSCEHPPCHSARDVKNDEATIPRHLTVEPLVNRAIEAELEHRSPHEPYQPGHGQSLCEDPPCPGLPRGLNTNAPHFGAATSRSLAAPRRARHDTLSNAPDAMMARHGDHDHDPPSNGPSCKRPPCHGTPSLRAIDVSASSQELTLRELRRNDQDLPPQHHGGVPKDPKVVRAHGAPPPQHHGAPPPEPYHGSKSPSPGGPPAALRGLRGINDVQERKFSGPPVHPVKGGGAGGHGDLAARAEYGAQPRSSGGAPPMSGSAGSGGFGGGSSGGGGGGILGRDSGGHGPLTGRGVLEDDGSELGPLKGGGGGHGAV